MPGSDIESVHVTRDCVRGLSDYVITRRVQPISATQWACRYFSGPLNKLRSEALSNTSSSWSLGSSLPFANGDVSHCRVISGASFSANNFCFYGGVLDRKQPHVFQKTTLPLKSIRLLRDEAYFTGVLVNTAPALWPRNFGRGRLKRHVPAPLKGIAEKLMHYWGEISKAICIHAYVMLYFNPLFIFLRMYINKRERAVNNSYRLLRHCEELLTSVKSELLCRPLWFGQKALYLESFPSQANWIYLIVSTLRYRVMETMIPSSSCPSCLGVILGNSKRRMYELQIIFHENVWCPLLSPLLIAHSSILSRSRKKLEGNEGI